MRSQVRALYRPLSKTTTDFGRVRSLIGIGEARSIVRLALLVRSVKIDSDGESQNGATAGLASARSRYVLMSTTFNAARCDCHDTQLSRPQEQDAEGLP